MDLGAAAAAGRVEAGSGAVHGGRGFSERMSG